MQLIEKEIMIKTQIEWFELIQKQAAKNPDKKYCFVCEAPEYNYILKILSPKQLNQLQADDIKNSEESFNNMINKSK